MSIPVITTVGRHSDKVACEKAQPAGYSIIASGAPTSYAIDKLPDGLTLNTATGVISGTVGVLAPPKVNSAISATNADGTATALLTWYVSAIGTPVVTSDLFLEAREGDQLSYRILATHGPTSFSAAGLPVGWTFNTTTGIIIGTIPGTDVAGPTLSLRIAGINGTGAGADAVFTIYIGRGGGGGGGGGDDGAAQILPAKRWADDEETLSIADLNATARPIAQLNANTVGAEELITADVIELLTEQALGISATFTVPGLITIGSAAPGSHGPNVIGTVDVAEARVNDAVWVSSVAGVDAYFYGLVEEDHKVEIRATACAGSETTLATLPAGTVLKLVVFTSVRIVAHGAPGGPPDPLETDTGYLEVTPGKIWKTAEELPPRGEAISTTGLDLMASGLKLALKPASIGKRELDPAALGSITAALLGGAKFQFKLPHIVTVPANGSAPDLLSLSFPGATTDQVVLCGTATGFPHIQWSAFVSLADTLTIWLRNTTYIPATVPKRTALRGKIL